LQGIVRRSDLPNKENLVIKLRDKFAGRYSYGVESTFNEVMCKKCPPSKESIEEEITLLREKGEQLEIEYEHIRSKLVPKNFGLKRGRNICITYLKRVSCAVLVGSATAYFCPLLFLFLCCFFIQMNLHEEMFPPHVSAIKN